jgi:membrane protein DedA with SNARE-associated domain
MDNAIYYYVSIFASLVAAGLGMPIPEELPVVTGGIFVGDPDKQLHWFIMLPVCILGVVISDVLLYGIGRLWGPRLVNYPWVRNRLLPPDRLGRIEGNFQKYGVKILLFARFLPGIRSPIFVTAGIMRLSFTKFLLADGLYAIPGVSILFWLGYWFTSQFLEIVEKAESWRPIIVVVVLTALATYLVLSFLKRPVPTGTPEEIPIIGNQVAQVAQIVDPPDQEETPIQPAPQYAKDELTHKKDPDKAVGSCVTMEMSGKTRPETMESMNLPNGVPGQVGEKTAGKAANDIDERADAAKRHE